MGCQIVEDDHIALLQNGGKLGFNIGVEDDAVHWCVDHPWCNKTSAFEASDQGLGAPVAKGCLGKQPLAFLAAPGGFCHLGVGACFVKKDQALTMFTHLRLAALFPFCPRLFKVRPVLFACPKCFF